MIKFKAMRNVETQVKNQLLKLHSGPGFCMHRYPHLVGKAYTSYYVKNGVVHGWAALVNWCPDWQIPAVSVYIDHPHRGKGLATKLVNNVLYRAAAYIDKGEIVVDAGRFPKLQELVQEHGLA